MIRKMLHLTKDILLSLFIVLFLVLFLFESAAIEGNSMVPTLLHKDQILIEKAYYFIYKPKFGDIIIFKYPADLRERFIKRVIATEGQSVKIQGNVLMVNNTPIQEPYLKQIEMEDFSEVIVPPDTVFVLGDNRKESIDSRNEEVGFIPVKLIVGRTTFRLFPFNKLGRIK